MIECVIKCMIAIRNQALTSVITESLAEGEDCVYVCAILRKCNLTPNKMHIALAILRRI